MFAKPQGSRQHTAFPSSTVTRPVSVRQFRTDARACPWGGPIPARRERAETAENNMDNFDDSVFEEFLAQGIVSSIEGIVKSGKEATVYRCLPGPRVTGQDGDSRSTAMPPSRAIAIKTYKDIEERSFRNLSGYLDGRIGRTIRKRRDILHLYSDPDSMQACWVDAEFEALSRLSARGLPVPRPYLRTGKALAMEFIEDDGGASPQLVHARVPREGAAELYRELVETIVEMLRQDLIHGDLSPYNILVRNGRLVIIDFPQAIDARYHSQAEAMFTRDLENVSRWFERVGVGEASGFGEVARRTWELYERNRL